MTVLLLILVLSLPLHLSNGYSILLDAPVRTTINGSLVESYSFWWTSLTYLPFFFFTLLLLICVSLGFNLRVRTAPVYLALLFLAYLTEVADYIPLNSMDLSTSYSNYGLNRLLTNALNKYHPFVFYFSVCTLLSISYSFLIGVMRQKVLFNAPLALLYWEKMSWLVILINLFSLFMGSWWALQEGTWGGWWNWDSSEVLGLEVSFTALALNHSYHRVLHYQKFSLKFLWLAAVLVMSYFFIQLNFELVSHNFGSKFFFFFNNNLFSIEVILGLLLCALIIFKFYSHLSETETNFLNSGMRKSATVLISLFKFYVPLLILVWMFWGYKPLLNYFSWNFLGLNLFNYDSSIQTANMLLLVGLLLYLVTYATRLLTLHFALATLSTNWLWLLVLTAPIHTVPTRVHLLIATFAAVNLAIADVSPVSWFTCTPYLTTFSPLTTLWASETSFTADSYAWDFVKGKSTLFLRTTSNWDTISLMNTASTNFFSLDASHSTCLNYYELGTSYATVYLEFQLPVIPSLAFSFLLGCVYLQRLRQDTPVSTP